VIDKTCVLDCTDPRAKLPACGGGGLGVGLGWQEQDSRTGRLDGVPAPQLLSQGHCPNSGGHRLSCAMGAEEEVQVTLAGGAPWGFRLQGGTEQRKPLQVSKVRESPLK
jgi:hypothetical protein